MCAEYIQEIGLESEPLLLHFLTLGIQQLTLFVCESWGFVIYNQFSALVSSVLFFFCSLYPALKALTAFLCCIGPLTLPFYAFRFLSVSTSSTPSLSPSPFSTYTAEACQVCPSCASSGSCLPWYIIREPREHRPTHSRGLSQPLHKCFAHDVEHYRPSEQVNDPACTETTFLLEKWQRMKHRSQHVVFLTSM